MASHFLFKTREREKKREEEVKKRGRGRDIYIGGSVGERKIERKEKKE